MSNRAAWNVDLRRLHINLDIELTIEQLNIITQWSMANWGHPVAVEFLDIYAQGLGQKKEPPPKGDNFSRARPDDAADAFAYMFERAGFGNRSAEYGRMFEGVFAKFGERVWRPSPPPPSSSGPSWRSVLGVPGTNRAEINTAYRRLQMENHSGMASPQAKEERMKVLNVAKQQAFKEVLT